MPLGMSARLPTKQTGPPHSLQFSSESNRFLPPGISACRSAPAATDWLQSEQLGTPMGMRSIMVVALLCLATAAQGRLAISANDGKQLQEGEPKTVIPDSVSVLDLAAYPPKVIGDVKLPASMIGSPVAVVVSRDESFAIVAVSQKYNPADPMHP